MSPSPREAGHTTRVVAGVAVYITELVWPEQRRSFSVHLVDGDVDLTEDGWFDTPPTDEQISALLAEHGATSTTVIADDAVVRPDLLRDLLSAATSRVGWEVDLDQLPVACAHTPHLVVALIDAAAAHLAALATHTALTEAAASIQTVIADGGPSRVDWFAAGLLGTVAQLEDKRVPHLGHTRRALLAALRDLQQEDAAWPHEQATPSPARRRPGTADPGHPSPVDPPRITGPAAGPQPDRQPDRGGPRRAQPAVPLEAAYARGIKPGFKVGFGLDIEEVTLAYTGHRVRWADVLDTIHRHPVGAPAARALNNICYDAAIAEHILDLVDPPAATGTSEPDMDEDELVPLKDSLLAARQYLIEHVHLAADLWSTLGQLLVPASLGQALSAAGFTPAVPSTGPYHHRDGDREVTVTVSPYPCPGDGASSPTVGTTTKVTVRQAGTVAWTIISGPQVPDCVVAAIAYTAVAAPGPRHEPTT